MEIIKGLLIALALVLQELLPDQVGNPTETQKDYLKVAIWVVAIVLLPAIDYFVRKGWRSIGTLRRYLNHCGAFEGVWLQRAGIPDRPYSIAIIRASDDRAGWIYEGVGYKPDFTYAASWSCRSLHFNEDRDEWYFIGDAKLVNEDDITKDPEFRVLPILKLPKERSSGILTGLVSDLAVGTPEAVFKVVMVRDKRIGYGRPSSIEDLMAMPASEIGVMFAQAPHLRIPKNS